MAADQWLAGVADGVRLVFARHGQTPSNVRQRLDTLPPGPGLTEHGGDQAAQLAGHLAGEEVVAVRASRAARARQTAEPVARRHGLEVEVVEGMQEIYVGHLEGRADAASRQHFEEIYADWHFGRLDRRMPGGESGQQALERFFGGARSAVDGVSAGAVVLVSHGAMLRLASAQLVPEVGPGRANDAYLPNTGLVVLEARESAPTGWRCLRWDGLDPDDRSPVIGVR